MKLGVKPKTINIAKQKGDMLETHGDNKKIKLFLKRKIRFISLDEGLEETINPNYDQKKSALTIRIKKIILLIIYR